MDFASAIFIISAAAVLLNLVNRDFQVSPASLVTIIGVVVFVPLLLFPTPALSEVPPPPEIPPPLEIPSLPEVPPPLEIPPPLEVPSLPEVPPPLEVPSLPEVPSPLEVPSLPEVPSPLEVPSLPEVPLLPEVPPPPQVPPPSEVLRVNLWPLILIGGALVATMLGARPLMRRRSERRWVHKHVRVMPHPDASAQPSVQTAKDELDQTVIIAPRIDIGIQYLEEAIQ